MKARRWTRAAFRARAILAPMLRSSREGGGGAWALEVAGVAGLGLAAALVHPAFGIALVSAYALLAANVASR